VTIVRYADDAVLGFQKHQDALECLASLVQRLGDFGLKVHPDKTKLIRFGRFALKKYAEKPSVGRPKTFNFLGFTHYLGRKQSGEVVVKRKTMRKRQISHLKRIKLELRKRLHDKPWETGRWLKRVIQGHINYYGVPFNSKCIGQFVEEVKKLWFKSLRRRSQRHRMTWERYNYYIKYWLPKPKIVHPYPEQRFYAKHPR
jgi:RNA-directed DNA polymerase